MQHQKPALSIINNDMVPQFAQDHDLVPAGWTSTDFLPSQAILSETDMAKAFKVAISPEEKNHITSSSSTRLVIIQTRIKKDIYSRALLLCESEKHHDEWQKYESDTLFLIGEITKQHYKSLKTVPVSVLRRFFFYCCAFMSHSLHTPEATTPHGKYLRGAAVWILTTLAPENIIPVLYITEKTSEHAILGGFFLYRQTH